jgi:hypothetical protein
MSDQDEGDGKLSQRQIEARIALSGEIRDTITSFLTNNVDLGTEEVVRAVFEVLSFQIGYIDVLCESMGIPDEQRHRSADYYSSAGRVRATEVLDQAAGLPVGTPVKSDEWKN